MMMDNWALIIAGSRTNVTVDKPNGRLHDDGDSDENSLDRRAYTCHSTAIVPAKRLDLCLHVYSSLKDVVFFS